MIKTKCHHTKTECHVTDVVQLPSNIRDDVMHLEDPLGVFNPRHYNSLDEWLGLIDTYISELS